MYQNSLAVARYIFSSSGKIVTVVKLSSLVGGGRGCIVGLQRSRLGPLFVGGLSKLKTRVYFKSVCDRPYLGGNYLDMELHPGPESQTRYDSNEACCDRGALLLF